MASQQVHQPISPRLRGHGAEAQAIRRSPRSPGPRTFVAAEGAPTNGVVVSFELLLSASTTAAIGQAQTEGNGPAFGSVRLRLRMVRIDMAKVLGVPASACAVAWSHQQRLRVFVWLCDAGIIERWMAWLFLAHQNGYLGRMASRALRGIARNEAGAAHSPLCIAAEPQLMDGAEAVAPPTVRDVGTRLVGEQMQPLSITRTHGGSWASEQGFAAGDLVIFLGARPTAELSKEEAATVMQSARPLRILVARAGRGPRAERFDQMMHVPAAPQLAKLDAAVVRIQAAFRHRVEWKKAGWQKRHDASVLLQAAWRGHSERRRWGQRGDAEETARLWRPSVAEQFETRTVPIVAGKQVDKLGIGFLGRLPPAKLIIQSITPGTWAAAQGFKVGDQVVEINGTSTFDMEGEEFKRALKRRPLSMRLLGKANEFSIGSQAQASTDRAGGVLGRSMPAIERLDVESAHIARLGVEQKLEQLKLELELADRREAEIEAEREAQRRQQEREEDAMRRLHAQEAEEAERLRSLERQAADKDARLRQEEAQAEERLRKWRADEDFAEEQMRKLRAREAAEVERLKNAETKVMDKEYERLATEMQRQMEADADGAKNEMSLPQEGSGHFPNEDKRQEEMEHQRHKEMEDAERRWKEALDVEQKKLEELYRNAEVHMRKRQEEVEEQQQRWDAQLNELGADPQVRAAGCQSDEDPRGGKAKDALTAREADSEVRRQQQELEAELSKLRDQQEELRRAEELEAAAFQRLAGREEEEERARKVKQLDTWAREAAELKAQSDQAYQEVLERATRESADALQQMKHDLDRARSELQALHEEEEKSAQEGRAHRAASEEEQRLFAAEAEQTARRREEAWNEVLDAQEKLLAEKAAEEAVRKGEEQARKEALEVERKLRTEEDALSESARRRAEEKMASEELAEAEQRRGKAEEVLESNTAEQAAMQEEVQCLKCATTFVPNAVFCIACGEKRPQVRCPRCGAAFGPRAAFCSMCGERRDKAQADEEQVGSTEVQDSGCQEVRQGKQPEEESAGETADRLEELRKKRAQILNDLLNIAEDAAAADVVPAAAGDACARCGTTFTSDDLFCAKCGKKRHEHCTKCDVLLLPDDVFCRKCGQKRDADADTKTKDYSDFIGSASQAGANAEENQQTDGLMEEDDQAGVPNQENHGNEGDASANGEDQAEGDSVASGGDQEGEANLDSIGGDVDAEAAAGGANTEDDPHEDDNSFETEHGLEAGDEDAGGVAEPKDAADGAIGGSSNDTGAGKTDGGHKTQAEAEACFQAEVGQAPDCDTAAETLQDQSLLHVVAGQKIDDIGLEMTEPPEPVMIKRAARDQWAETNGIRAGDELVLVNGRYAQDIPWEELGTLLRTRPVRLSFRQHPLLELTVPAFVHELGMEFYTPSQGRALIKQVSVGSWADVNNLRMGDELMWVNDKQVRGLGADALQKALRSRPLVLSMRQRPLVELRATEKHAELGFSTTQPSGRLLIKHVAHEQWASDTGLNVGDELVTLNGKVTSKMDAIQFAAELEARPLRLGVRQQATIDFIVEEGVGDLGFHSDQGVLVEVVPDGWADGNWLHLGDELVAVDGVSVQSMRNARELEKALAVRPEVLSFRIPPLLILVANADDLDLGVELTDPPDNVLVTWITPGSWADLNGLGVGDELVFVGVGDCDTPVWDLSAAELQEMLSGRHAQRPLRISVRQQPLVEIVARRLDVDLGVEVTEPFPPERLYVSRVVDGGWADVSDLGPGDELVTINSVPARFMRSSQIEELMGTRPLRLGVRPRSFIEVLPPGADQGAGEQSESKLLIVTAMDEDGLLGFEPETSADQPPEPVFVRSIKKGTWAERVGVGIGDQLAEVGGLALADMSQEDFLAALQTPRPLEFAFRRAADCVADDPARGVADSYEQIGLGLKVGGSRGQRALVTRVLLGSWAEACGVRVGDELVAVDGRRVRDATRDDISAELARWPPPTMVLRPRPFVEMSVANVQGLGFRTSRPAAPHGRVLLSAVDPGSWADLAGLSVGDELVAVGSSQASALSEEDLAQSLRRTVDQEVEEHRLTFWQFPLLELVATEAAIGRLGFETTLPPEKVLVIRVVPGSWADEAGVNVADEIVAVDGSRARELTPETLRANFDRFSNCVAGESASASPGVAQSSLMRLSVRPRPLLQLLASTCDADLGFDVLKSSPTSRAVVWRVQPGSWADARDVSVGDEVVMIGDAVIGRSTTEAEINALLGLDAVRPMHIWLRQRPLEAFTVDKDVESVGFTTTRAAAETAETAEAFVAPRALLREVFVGGWAESLGLSVGDELVEVNGQRARQMGKRDLRRSLAARPLRLAFRRRPLIELTIGKHTKSSGFTTTDPPDVVLLKTVAAGSWADLAGLGVGDELVTVGARVPQDMSVGELKRELTLRPLCFSIRPKPLVGFIADSVEKLGFKVTHGGERVYIRDIVSNSWAEANYMKVGDEIVGLGDRTARGMSGEELANALKIRPLLLTVRQSVIQLKVPDWHLHGQPLGFDFNHSTERVVLKHVWLGSWGASQELRAGDELMMVNGQSSRSMNVDELRKALVARPLTLVFWQQPLTELVSSIGGFELGMLSTLPSQRVLLERVTPGSWADRRALCPGDELVEIDGTPLHDVNNADDLNNAFAQAPQTCTFVFHRRPAIQFFASVDGGDTGVRFGPAAPPSGKAYVHHVMNGSWADQNGISTGDEIVALDGHPVAEKTWEEMAMAFDGSGGYEYSLTPLGLSVRLHPVVELVAPSGEDAEPLGLFTALAAHPCGRVLVRLVLPDSWASAQRIGVGDELVAVGAQPARLLAARGKLAEALTASQSHDAIEPTILAFRRRPVVEAAIPRGEDEKLGVDVVLRAPLPPVLGPVTVGSNADWYGLSEGDEVVAVGMRDARSMNPEELRRAFRKRTLRVSIRQLPVIDLTAEARDGELGIILTQALGRVVVREVQQGSWAERHGVNMGDELVWIGEQKATEVKFSDLKKTIKRIDERPLVLSFRWQRLDELVADTDVSTLGIATTRPPEPVIVQDILPGSWADKHMLGIGDEVVVLGSRLARQLGERDFDAEVARRPTQLFIRRQAVMEVTAAKKIDELGFRTTLPPNAIYVKSVLAGSFAEKQGIQKGFELISIAETSVRNMSAQELSFALKEQRPLRMRFRRLQPRQIPEVAGEAHSSEPETSLGNLLKAGEEKDHKIGAEIAAAVRDELFHITAELTDKKLGLVPSGAPPARVLMKRMVRGAWAERKGVHVGDELVLLNDKRVREMASKELEAMMSSTRPLKMSFRRQALKEIVAGQGDIDVGFETTRPPELIIVKQVLQASWAAKHGMNIGDEIVEVNGKRAQDMSLAEFQNAMSSRPITMKMRQQPLFEAIGEASDVHLGFTTYQTENEVLLRKVALSSWADANGLCAGDELVLIGGEPADEMSPARLAKALGHRPVHLSFRKQPLFDLPVQRGDAHDVGFTWTSPPDPVLIKQITPAGWAADQGLATGYELVAVGGKRARECNADTLRALLERRPTELTFRRVPYMPRDPADTQHEVATPDQEDPVAPPRITVEVVAGDADKDLGIIPAAWPPKPVVLRAAPAGTFAVAAGLAAGDELIELGGRQVHAMSRADLERAMRERPLRLKLWTEKPVRVAKPGADMLLHVSTVDKPLGIEFHRPPDRALLKASQPGSWAKEAGLLEGDEVLEIDGKSVVKIRFAEIQRVLEQQRPLKLLVRRQPLLAEKLAAERAAAKAAVTSTFRDAGDDGEGSAVGSGTSGEEDESDDDGELHELLADTGVDNLGFDTKGGPPPAQLFVRNVQPASWAERAGMSADDELVMIGTTQVEDMTERELRRLLSERPLRLWVSKTRK